MTRPIPGAHLSINDSGMFDPKIPHLGIFSEFAPAGDGVEELAQVTIRSPRTRDNWKMHYSRKNEALSPE